MLNTLKNIIAGIVSKLGYELVPKKLNDAADDPIAILGLLLQSEDVSVIIDGGASIGDTSQKFSILFPTRQFDNRTPQILFVPRHECSSQGGK